MAQFQNMFEVDLNNRSYPVSLVQTVSEGNVYSNRIGAYVYADGAPVNLGGACTGLVMRADGTTVPLTGYVDGNAAYVVLDQPSCAIPGPIQVAVNSVVGENITTLLVAYGTVILTDTRNYVEPGTPIPDITELLAEIDNMREATVAAEAAATKSVRYDTTQSLTSSQKSTARGNINAAFDTDVSELQNEFRTNLGAASTKIRTFKLNKYFESVHGALENLNGYACCDQVPVIPDHVFMLSATGASYSLWGGVAFDGNGDALGWLNPTSGVIYTNNILATYPKAISFAIDIKPSGTPSTLAPSDVADWFVLYDALSLPTTLRQNLFPIGDVGKTEEELTFTDTTGFYDLNGTWNNYSNVKISNAVSCSYGDVFIFAGHRFLSIQPAIFLDSSNNVVGVTKCSPIEVIETHLKIAVPRNAVKFEIQSLGRYTDTVKLYKTTSEGAILDSESVYHGLDSLEDILNMLGSNNIPVNCSFEPLNGYIDPNKQYYVYSNVLGETISVYCGEKYTAKGYSYYGVATFVLYDENGNITRAIAIGEDADYHTKTITINVNEVSMLIQRYKTKPVNIYKAGYDKHTGSILSEKKITVIGDSVTEHNFRAKTNWEMWLGEWAGVLVQNLGISGTGFAADIQSENCYIHRISQIQANPDIIGIATSFNDTFIDGLPIGTKSDTGANSVAGYINDFFDALLTAYPTTPIICYCQCPWGSRRPGVQVSDDYIEVVKEICADKGIPFYSDLYYGCILKPWINANKTYYYTSDDPDHVPSGTTDPDTTHPNSEGHKAIARYLYPKFAQNLITTGLDYQ